MSPKKKPKRSRVQKIVEQVKEPLSLLETLKEEGMARAMYLLTAASFAAKNVKKDKIIENLRDGVHALGLVTRNEFAALEERIEALEEQVRALSPSDEEE